MIHGEKTILPIVTFDDNTTWANLYELTKSHLERDGLARLVAALSSSVKCVAIETQYIDKDYRDTFSNFHSKRFSTPSSRCLRFHFFSNGVTRAILREACVDEAKQKELNEMYL